MTSFFFIFKKDTQLVRVKVKGEILPKYDKSYFSNLIEDLKESYLEDILSKSSKEIEITYRKRINKLNMFFKNQFSFISAKEVNKSSKYTYFDEEEFLCLLGQIDILFDEQTFGDKSDEELDKYKIVVEPNKLLDIIDTNLKSLTEMNNKINDNHKKILEVDNNLLLKKNALLHTKNPNKFSEMIEIIKEREKISYLVLDIDADITNSLIELYNIKYIKLREYDILLTLDKIKNEVKSIKNIQFIFKIYDNKYFS